MRYSSRNSARFVYDVEAIEIALFMNSIAWARYFGYPVEKVAELQLYSGMSRLIPARGWYTGALVLIVFQAVCFVSRTYQARRAMFILYVIAGLISQWALWHIDVITMNEYQNLGLLIASAYAFARLSIRHRTVRIG